MLVLLSLIEVQPIGAGEVQQAHILNLLSLQALLSFKQQDPKTIVTPSGQ